MKFISTILVLTAASVFPGLANASAPTSGVAAYHNCGSHQYGADILRATQKLCFGAASFQVPSKYAHMGKWEGPVRVAIAMSHPGACNPPIHVDEQECFERFVSICSTHQFWSKNYGCQYYFIHRRGMAQGGKRDVGAVGGGQSDDGPIVDPADPSTQADYSYYMNATEYDLLEAEGFGGAILNEGF